MRKMKFLTLVVFTGILVATGAAIAQMTDTSFARGVVSADGAIRLPSSFRTDYVMLGAWSVVGDAYRKTGTFPDGTVLVKELFKGKTESLTTGEATSAKENAGYFVMVKDSKGRFPDNPLWGDGWGWAFFKAGETAKTVTKDYKGECLACHEPARSTDLVYDYAYPLLK
jgi:hypothetical protein